MKTVRKIIASIMSSVMIMSCAALVHADPVVEINGFELPAPYSSDHATKLELGFRYFINDPGTGSAVFKYVPQSTAHYKISVTSSDGTSNPRLLVFDEWRYGSDINDGENLEGRTLDTDLTEVTVSLPRENICYFVVVDQDGGNVHDAYITVTLEDIVIDHIEIESTVTPCAGDYAENSRGVRWPEDAHYRVTTLDEAGEAVATTNMIGPWHPEDNTQIDTYKFSLGGQYINSFWVTPDDGYCISTETSATYNGLEMMVNAYNALYGSINFSPVIAFKDNMNLIFNFFWNSGGGHSYMCLPIGSEYTFETRDDRSGYDIEHSQRAYRFCYWLCEEGGDLTGERAFPGDTFTVDRQYIFRAVWEQYPVVHFDMNGHGNQIDDVLLGPGDTLGSDYPASPSEEGYIFEGWFVDEALTEEFNKLESINEDTILYAKWTAEEVPVNPPAEEPSSSSPAGTETPSSSTEAPETPAETPSSTTPSPEQGVAGFVERLYTVALGRSSDAQGKQDWIDAVTLRGETGAGCARGFLYSPEFLNKDVSNETFVTVLYRTFFDREPDTDGFNGWVNALNGGASKQDVIEGFINSTEWANLCLRFGIRSGGTGVPNITVEPNQKTIDFATRLYTTCLGREADEDGLMAWARQLANQRDTGTGAAHGFFFSSEFTGQTVSNSEFVTRLYRTFMGREPDTDGFNAWVAQLDSGVSREEVFNGFACSPEFSAICADYGIIR